MALTVFRIIALPFLVCWCATGEYTRFTFALYALATLSDFFDGIAARTLGGETQLGAWLDQMVDKVFMVFLLAAVCYHEVSRGLSPWTACLLITLFIIWGRDWYVARLRAKHSQNVIPVSYLGKAKMWALGLALGATIWRIGFVQIGPWWFFSETMVSYLEHAFWVIALCLTIGSGYQYHRRAQVPC